MTRCTFDARVSLRVRWKARFAMKRSTRLMFPVVVCAALMSYPEEFCSFNGDHTPDPKDSGQGTSWEYQEAWNFLNQF